MLFPLRFFYFHFYSLLRKYFFRLLFLILFIIFSYFISSPTHSQVEFIYSILSNLTKQCPNGQVLDTCLSHFLQIIQRNYKCHHEKLTSENIEEEKSENKKDVNLNIDNDHSNDHVENDKNNDRILNEQSQRKIAALDAISDLFLSEIENENNEDTTSSTHVHTSSCNHDHHNDASVKR